MVDNCDIRDCVAFVGNLLWGNIYLLTKLYWS